MKQLARLVSLMALLAALAPAAFAQAAEAPAAPDAMPRIPEPAASPSPEALRLSLLAGLGVEGETARPWAVVPRLGLLATRGFMDFSVDACAAIPDRFLDSAGLEIGASPLSWSWGRLGARALLWWRDLGYGAEETRLGLVFVLGLGAELGEDGLFSSIELGDSILWTRYSIESGVPAQRDQDPLGRLDLGYRTAGGLAFDFAISDYGRQDATLYLKTIFELGAALERRDFGLEARLGLKYTDFFTFTGYLDGAYLRLTAVVPLGSVPLGPGGP